MDAIYSMYGVYLYDNQLNHDYLIFYNNKRPEYIPYYLSQALSSIYHLNGEEKFKESIEIITEACNSEGLLLIKNDNYLTLTKTKKSHIPTYNAYDINWNETKSGFNPFEYNRCGIWNIGKSTYSSYRIDEYKHNREWLIRDNKIKEILND
jgi:hypothetical protein